MSPAAVPLRSDADLARGPVRLARLLLRFDVMDPRERGSPRERHPITWGIHPSPFGPCLIGRTSLGICEVGFYTEAQAADAIQGILMRWPESSLRRDDQATRELAERIFARSTTDPLLPLHLRGTSFQLRVWRALLNVLRGQVTTYGEIAHALGAPGAARAVGGAVGANPVAYLVPCHRVVRSSGALGGYRWSVPLKRAILSAEMPEPTGPGRPDHDVVIRPDA
jgi:AraC family transcriptional regulator, regulatory protein of adaptative response / methylated-DNA-[protein]-cysteine methyltransferase